MPGWSLLLWDKSTLLFTCRICQETELAYFSPTQMHVTWDATWTCPRAPVWNLIWAWDDSQQIELTTSRPFVLKKVATKGPWKDNWCIWNLLPVYFVLWISCVWKHLYLCDHLGDKELSATVLMQGWRREEEIHYCVRDLCASQRPLVPLLGFKVVCYNVAIA